MSNENDLTLEKLRIVEQLTEIKLQQGFMTSKLQENTDLTKTLHSLLVGDGTDSKPGIQMRLDRLEQSEKQKAWIWSSIAAIALEHLRHIFFGK